VAGDTTKKTLHMPIARRDRVKWGGANWSGKRWLPGVDGFAPSPPVSDEKTQEPERSAARNSRKALPTRADNMVVTAKIRNAMIEQIYEGVTLRASPGMRKRFPAERERIPYSAARQCLATVAASHESRKVSRKLAVYSHAAARPARCSGGILARRQLGTAPERPVHGPQSPYELDMEMDGEGDECR